MNKWLGFCAFALFALVAMPLYASAESNATMGSSAPTEAKYFSLSLAQGWNLISVPIHTPYGTSTGLAYIYSTTCTEGPLYNYANSQKSYFNEGTVKVGAGLGAGKGYWYKAPKGCQIDFSASSDFTSPDNAMDAGWNQLGAPLGITKFSDIKGTCDVTSGPYKFATAANKWENADTLIQGEGYFIRVSGPCQLGGGSPPQPPEISPKPKPAKGFDLGVQDLVFSNNNPKVDESFTVTAVLYNYGDVGGYLKSHSISFVRGSASGGSAVLGPGSAIYIGPRQYYKAQFSQPLYSEGNWKVTVTISPDDDSNSANNQLSESIIVGGGTQTCPTGSGDGNYVLNMGCEVKSTSGYKVKLVDISAYAPSRGQFDVTDQYGTLVKRVYLGYYESTYISEAGNLYLYVGNIYPVSASPKSALDLTVKSGATPTVTAIPGKPDLTITTTGTSDNLVGSIAKLPFTAYNYGAAKSPATTVLVTGDTPAQSFAVPELLPGDSYWNALSFAIADKPLIAVTFMVDPYNYIPESEEANNKFTYSIYPVKPTATPTPEPTIILHRITRNCATDAAIGAEQVFQVGGSTGYDNYKCYNRKSEQCSDRYPDDTYYDERCEYPSSGGGGGGAGVV